MRSRLRLLVLPALLLPLACLFAQKSTTSTPAWKGQIIFGYSGDDIQLFDLATRKNPSLFKEAFQPFLTPSGDIYFVSQRFGQRNAVIRRSNATATQFRDVLDMTSNNPAFKQRLEDYSVIRGTGNSGVLDGLLHPKVSPNGRYLAVTINGDEQQIYNKESVAIFDLATTKMVAQFPGKYHGSWTPDNRLVMAGSDKWGSTDQKLNHGPEPGLYISNADFSALTRIDKGLDDPAPYHPSVSPDGRQVAFVLNDHVWVMSLNGQGLRQLTAADNDNIETFPTWSPDGRFIASWVYKTFERTYYTALAIVPANAPRPVVLSNTAPVWPKDTRGYRLSGGSMQLSWKMEGVKVPVVNAQKPKAPAPKPPAPKTGPKVGSKVKFEAEDGQIYTGIITEVKAGQFKVRYDGTDFDAWLIREQFEVVK